VRGGLGRSAGRSAGSRLGLEANALGDEALDVDLDQDGDDRADNDAVAAIGAGLAEPEAEGNAVDKLNGRDVLPEEKPKSSDGGAGGSLGRVDGDRGAVKAHPDEGIGADVGDREGGDALG
jgi:hypothetical protein